MAERNEEMVKVTLNRQRPYRAKDSDRDAVLVGPGAVEVPRWVAEKWGVYIAPPDDPQAGANAEGFTVGDDDGLKIASNAVQFASEPPAIPEQLPNDAVSGTVETVQTMETPDTNPRDAWGQPPVTIETVEPFVTTEAVAEAEAEPEAEPEKPRNKGGRRKGS